MSHSHSAALHHKKAAYHHEQAAHHHRKASEHYEVGDHRNAAHHAHAAQGHTVHAQGYANEASMYHAVEDAADEQVSAGYEQATEKPEENVTNIYPIQKPANESIGSDGHPNGGVSSPRKGRTSLSGKNKP